MRLLPLLIPALLATASGLTVQAEPIAFNIPAQDAAAALLAFSEQSHVNVLFSFDELREASSPGVIGTHEPPVALARLLAGTGFTAQSRPPSGYVVISSLAAVGQITGRLLQPDDEPARNVEVVLRGHETPAYTDSAGRFLIPSVTPGVYRIEISAPDLHPLRITRVRVAAGQELDVGTHRLSSANRTTQLAPFIVEAAAGGFDHGLGSAGAERRAIGNLDLVRTENDPLPYTIYRREQISRSGLVALSDFLQRVILERPAEQPLNTDAFGGGGPNLSLRGYATDETVVLVNGRRMPEMMTSEGGALPPDVDLIPLSLVQQVEVLPASASALYSGNPVGGVINIVLRPDMDATEITATYTNATGGFSAGHSSIALLHGQSLLSGALRFRLSAAHSRAAPARESDLGYRQAAAQRRRRIEDRLYRATPHVRSANDTPLFGLGAASHTSVAPGSDGSAGLAAFTGREGRQNLDFFDSSGDLAASIFSVDSPYGRDQQRTTYVASATYDLAPWLQLGLDVTRSRTIAQRGLDVFAASLNMSEDSPLNPFSEEVVVTLNETAPALGERYSQSRIDFQSFVGGMLIRLPAAWTVSLDGQYTRNIAGYRGIAEADPVRWQALIDAGEYQPLRDTQVHAPPDAFYDDVLVFHGRRGQHARIGDYRTIEGALRATNAALPLPTGPATLNLGADYRRNELAPYFAERRYGNGSLAESTSEWAGRTIQRYSFFSELNASLLTPGLRPRWLRDLEGNVAVRYVAADTSRESNLAPTYGLKLSLAGGLSFRGSITSSNRFPAPIMSRRIEAPGAPGSGLNLVVISDPLRGEQYEVHQQEEMNPNLRSEEALTQTAGIVYQRGNTHRFRLSLDYFDTHKAGELVGLDAQAVVTLESLFPDRVERIPDGTPVGQIRAVNTGSVNASSRRSRNWNASVDYLWTDFMGGTLELRSRVVYFHSYDLQLFANTGVVDQLKHPDGSAPTLLRYRANFTAGWSNAAHGFGLDGQYFHSRMLPLPERQPQGSDKIKPYWQLDAFLQADLGRWIGWTEDSRQTLRGQLRVNNLFGFDPPKYANEGTGAGVQSYGDWRGRVYSISITASF